MRPHSPADDKALPNSFPAFAFLWAVVILFDLVATGRWIDSLKMGAFNLTTISQSLLALIALIVIFQPTAVLSFLLLAGLQVIDVLLGLPIVSNHSVLMMFVNLTILFSATWLYLGRKSLSLNTARLINIFSPAVRLQLLIVYLFAAFHKFNTAYINPETSCAVQFYNQIGSWIPFFPQTDWVNQLAIYGSLIIESLIPVLLFFSPVRLIGIIIGLVFHYMLALDIKQHFFDFSSTMFALYFLFMPASILLWLKERWGELEFGARKISFFQAPNYYKLWRWVFMVIFSIIIISGLQSDNWGLYRVFFWGRYLFWFAFGAIFILLFLLAVIPRHIKDPQPGPKLFFKPASAILVIFPLLVFLNGLTPYLGLKTRTSFDMYSNLRLEGGVSNHLIMPQSLDLGGYLADVVTIESSSDPILQSRYIDAGMSPVYFEFQAYTSSHPDIDVTYKRNNLDYTANPVTDSPELSMPPSLIARKLLNFRPVDQNQPERCQW